MASTISEITSSPFFSLLLRLIKGHNNISPLLNKGATYSDIFLMLEKAEKFGFLKKSNNTLILTKYGDDFIKKLPNTPMKHNGWVAPPSEEHRCEKIETDVIFLPSIETVEKL